MGRRGSPVAPLEEIPPPRTGWTMVIHSLIYSRIIDPGNDRGKLIYDLRFYSPTPKPPLLVKHDGPIEIIERNDNEPAHYRRIRAMADLAFPNGWQHERQNKVFDETAKQFKKHGEQPHSPDTMRRALGYRD
jgi:hypothetical protein